MARSIKHSTRGGGNQQVNKILRQSDGKYILFGSFNQYLGAHNRIVRINSDGTVDGSFSPGTGANGQIFTAAFQSDGKIMIAGSFTTYNGTTRNRIARLNADGSLDMSFDPGTGPNNQII